jgi:hypothetical protein
MRQTLVVNEMGMNFVGQEFKFMPNRVPVKSLFTIGWGVGVGGGNKLETIFK